jgi:hypothetical protein
LQVTRNGDVSILVQLYKEIQLSALHERNKYLLSIGT